MQRRKNLPQRWPIITILLVLTINLIFVLGIATSGPGPYHIGFYDLGLYGPVSPSNTRWWFYTIGPYPACEDVRGEVWRLVSMQFVHDGIMHIGGNSIAILLFGSIVEIFHPLGHVFVLFIFEVGIVFGVLGYSLLWPYVGIIGASPGCYALMGACWFLAFFQNHLLDPFVCVALPLTLVFEMICDVALYSTQYNSTTAYASHGFGLVTAFFVTMALSLCYPAKYHYTPLSTSTRSSRAFQISNGNNSSTHYQQQVVAANELHHPPAALSSHAASSHRPSALPPTPQHDHDRSHDGDPSQAQATRSAPSCCSIHHTCRLLYGGVGLVMSTLIISFLLYHYLAFSPPRPYLRPGLHNAQQSDTCCANLFSLLEEYGDSMTKSEIVQAFPCLNDDDY